MKKKKQKNELSLIGKIIDLPIEEFKEELKKQNLSIGVLKNLSIHFVSAYNDLIVRKDTIIQNIDKGILLKEDKKVVDVLNGIYSEMMKIEEKSLYVNGLIKELSVLNTPEERN